MYHGIINVYKEKGMTSFDVVAKLRKICGQKKIGHTGTLDPDAEGVLPVCLGKATKVCDLLTDRDKEYVTVLRLGVETDTQDLTGNVIMEKDASGLAPAEVTDVIRSFVGVQEQIPPMFSAKKVNGKKLYEYAREGVEVKRKPETITIYGIDILDMNLPEVRLRVACSKGTYIRTLCHDIGQKLGVGGAMASLVRTKAAGYAIEQAHRLDEIAAMAEQWTLGELLQPVEDVFKDLPGSCCRSEYDMPLLNGSKLPAEAFADEVPENGTSFRAYTADGVFVGLYYYCADEGTCRVRKLFIDETTKQLIRK
ncbi:MAG: tRNA pseudouridine(55) synthase TruB [Eubacterium sp.]|nr:tRNA pseudouridine(55) synthase TruB [Eubacterium sp.]